MENNLDPIYQITRSELKQMQARLDSAEKLIEQLQRENERNQLDNASLAHQRDELLAVLRGTAAIAHCGGLAGMSQDDAMISVRRATLPYFDKNATNEQHREALAAAKQWKEQ